MRTHLRWCGPNRHVATNMWIRKKHLKSVWEGFKFYKSLRISWTIYPQFGYLSILIERNKKPNTFAKKKRKNRKKKMNWNLRLLCKLSTDHSLFLLWMTGTCPIVTRNCYIIFGWANFFSEQISSNSTTLRIFTCLMHLHSIYKSSKPQWTRQVI